MDTAINSINSALEIVKNAKLKIQRESLGAANVFLGGYTDNPTINPLMPPPMNPIFQEQVTQTRVILDRETSFMDRLNSTNNYTALNPTNYQDLLDARAMYNIGGDPKELFSDTCQTEQL